MGQWETTLANKIEDLPSIVKSAKKFNDKYSSYLQRYKGGMPRGFFAAIAAIESDGKMIEGDPDLGEYGFFQITAKMPTDYGLKSELRKTAEGNIFLAGLEYNVEAKRLKLKYPNLIVEGTADQWKLARLVFAIGKYGVDTCIKHAKPMVPGRVFEALETWADETGAIAIGSSPAGKIRMRIKLVSKVAWEAGKQVTYQSNGMPVKVPAPSGISYTLPKSIRPFLHEENSSLLLVGMALLLLF